jgi:alkylhydroperoxidase/carboxymuconolactone decarboxylase family protein YurZ
VNNNLERYKSFFDAVYEKDALDSKTKNLIALGASRSAGCEPEPDIALQLQGRTRPRMPSSLK